MKKITVKLSELHKLFKMSEYEVPFDVEGEDIFIEKPDGDYTQVKALVLKRTNMMSCRIEGIDEPYVCAENHIILGVSGWTLMKDCSEVVMVDGSVRKVISKTEIGEQDSYDVSINSPHAYCTTNGLVHHNTFLAVYKGVEEVLDKSNPFKQVVIIRSTVSVRDIGYLPGDQETKIEIYEQPYKEICQTLFGRTDAWDRLKEQGHVRFISTAFIRGITIDDAIIVVDEVQNMTWAELSSVVGRCGHRSKIVFCGDKFQNDLVKNKNDVSGLGMFLEILRDMEEYQEIYFTPDDIVRSSIVKNFILACERKGLLPGS